MEFDYRALIGLIVEHYGTQYMFAKDMDLSERSVSLKLNNKVPWKDSEIYKACQLLGIDAKDMGKYFFKENVQVI